MTATEAAKTDLDLVERSLRGDRDSFGRLIRRYQNLVFGLCQYLLNNREDALDATQDTFITAYRRLPELRSPNDFRSWLRSIASNSCKQRVRARRSGASLAEEIASADEYRNLELSMDLERSFRALSPEVSLSIILFYLEGNSVAEIARFLNLPESTIASRIRNGRFQLRQQLESMFDLNKTVPSLPADFADRIPIPYDEYPAHRISSELPILSEWRRNWLLQNLPPGSKILRSEVAGHSWEAPPDRDVRVFVQLPRGEHSQIFIRNSPRKDGVTLDAKLLPVLSAFGLNVPEVIAPATPAENTEALRYIFATTPAPGQNVLDWAIQGGTLAIDRACEVVLEGIEQVKALTEQVRQSDLSTLIETCSLAEELERVIEIGGPWMEDERFLSAVKKLEPIVAKIDLPLVFSDSGIGSNARVDAEGNLIGFESFAWARIEDPHYQVTKYWTYDCWPIRRAGFVERYLVRNSLTMGDFAPRLGVRALVTLQREIPVVGPQEEYRKTMLSWLELAVNRL